MGMAISLILTSCAKHNKDDKTHNDLGSGDKSNLPVTLTLLLNTQNIVRQFTIVVVIKKMRLRLR